MNQTTGAWVEGLSKNRMIELTGYCHDCKGKVAILVEKESGGVFVTGGMVWKFMDIEKPFFKCQPCFDKEPILRNYRPTEVWSRVCGFMRPVSGFNKGKQAEFHRRKMFNMRTTESMVV